MFNSTNFFRDFYKDDFKVCPAAYIHKFFFLDFFLVAEMIENNPDKYGKLQGPLFTIVVQKPDEFVITGVEVFHSGFNMGININEAINFGYDDWHQNESIKLPNEVACTYNCEYRSEGVYIYQFLIL